MKTIRKEYRDTTLSFLLIGCGYAVAFWVVDSLLSSFLTDSFSFFQQMIGEDHGKTATRILGIIFGALFGGHAWMILNRHANTAASLRDNGEKQRELIESIDEGYYEVDMAGKLTFVNNAMCKITGYSKEELRAMDALQYVDEKKIRDTFNAYDSALLSGRNFRDLEWKFNRRDGTVCHVETTLSLLRDKEGLPIGFRGFLRDTTHRKATEALQKAKTAAESASQAKSAFLANVSHEIRTPLNAIIGLSSLMVESNLSERQREDLSVVKSAAHALLSLINDILDFSRIEAGKMELEKTAFKLRAFLWETLKIVSGDAHQKGLELLYKVEPDVADGLVGDSSRLRQVILNLVGNAIKFTDKGEIAVFVSGKERTETGITLHLSVADTGIGISQENQERIFQAFEQAESNTYRRFGGSGLGLAVSDQLVNLMGGRLWVESAPGEGSVFHFTARLTCHDEGKRQDPPLPDKTLAGKRALIVDDNLTHRGILCEMMQAWNIDSTAVSEAGEAKNLLMHKRVQSGAAFDLVLIDAEMPDKAGTKLVQWIQKERIEAKIILMLSQADRINQPELMMLGILPGVTKPVNPSQLMEEMRKAMGVTPSGPDRSLQKQEEANPPDQHSRRSLRILVAEDTPFNQKYITRLLEHWGHEAVIVENGRKALDVLAKENIDMVFMDVLMPEMDGFETVSAIREAEKGTDRHIPIVAMTARALTGDRERCLEAGMDAYIPKPVDWEKLRHIIHAFKPGVMTEIQHQAVHEDSPLPFDREWVLKTYSPHMDFFKEAVDMFVKDYPPMMAAIGEAIKNQNGDALRLLAHGLNGMATNFKAAATAKAAKHLEDMGREETFSNARQVYDHLTQDLDRLEKSLLEMVGTNENYHNT